MHKQIQVSLAVMATLLLAIIISGCASHSVVAVTTATAANQELLTTLDLSGVLVPVQSANIASQISGQVASLGFQAGSAVKAGDILMTLDTAILSAQLASAEAGLQSAEAAVEASKSQASVTKITLDAAQKSYDRTKSLFDAGAASQSQLDDATDKLDTATAQYENAAGPAQDQAQAAVSTAQANVRNLSVQLSHATIRSPLDGVLTSQNVSVGEVVSPGVAVISVVDASSLKLKSTVSQDILPLLANGQGMDVTIDSFPGSSVKGAISCIGPIAVSTGEMFPIEVTIKNDGKLMAGLSAHATMAAHASGIVVPSAAVVHSNGTSYVFVVKDGMASKRLVNIGLKSDQGTLILKGLAAGERVAITNVSALTDNMPVEDIVRG
ncbi:MAG: efflux RND transporter periplasmic adaptor subunit [Thermacetogeniaceae bacterium]